MSSPFVHGPHAQRQRADKARALARWCYQRGIGPAVASQPPQVLRAAARAAAVITPHLDDQGHSPTWQLVAELLRARVAWDRAHGQQPPQHVPCISCAVLPDACTAHTPTRAPACCRGCAAPLDRTLAAAGLDLHPSCDEPDAAPATHADTTSAALF